MDTSQPPPPADLRAVIDAELRPALAAGALVTDPDVIGSYSHDEAIFCPGDGAVALVRATTIEDVQATMRFASTHGVPVVPRGARTGISCLLYTSDAADE